VLGRARSLALMQALFDVEKVKDMRSLRRLYTRTP
jgi:hypothetical protein